VLCRCGCACVKLTWLQQPRLGQYIISLISKLVGDGLITCNCNCKISRNSNNQDTRTSNLSLQIFNKSQREWLPKPLINNRTRHLWLPKPPLRWIAAAAAAPSFRASTAGPSCVVSTAPAAHLRSCDSPWPLESSQGGTLLRFYFFEVEFVFCMIACI
jgi:hypothetical protein